MFRALAILASLIGASAFAPASMRATSSALRMSFEDAIGAQGKKITRLVFNLAFLS